MTNGNEPLFDVIATNIKTKERRLMDTGMTEADADSYVKIAVARRGVEEEFFKKIPYGTFSELNRKDTQ